MIKKTITLFAATMLLFAGCGGGYDIQNELSELNNDNMKKLVTCYTSFQSQNSQGGFMGPESEEKFKEFLNGEGASKFLEYIGVDKAKINDLMISDRDGQPFKFRWNVQGARRGSDEPVIFEAAGVDGKKMVGFTSFRFVEATDQEYEDWFNGKYVPGSGVENQGGRGSGR